MSNFATNEQLQKMYADFKMAKRKLIACDYDGVLSELKDDASADASKPTPQTLALLEKIANQPDTTLAIITGRKKDDVESWFKDSPAIYLSAEHGGWRKINGEWKQHMTPDPKQIEAIVTAMRPFTERVPGSHIETKTFGVVWHYRTADPTTAQVAIPDLQLVLESITNGTGMGVYTSNSGGNIVEVKPTNMNKGGAIESLLTMTQPDFVMCLGDDYTDEHMFEACPDDAYTIRVRGGDTIAKLAVKGVPEVFDILDNLANK